MQIRMYRHMILYLVIICTSFAVGMHGIPSTSPALVIIDGFSEFLSGNCKTYCEEHGIRVVEAISPYICNMFQSQGREVPESLRAPIQEDEIVTWACNQGLIDESGDATASNMRFNPNTLIISESDSGVSTAEKIASVLNLPGNGMSPHLHNKFQSNEKAKSLGINVLDQKLVSTVEESVSFAQELWINCDDVEKRCIVKPYRGVASDGVFLCRNIQEVEDAFHALYNKPCYGGGKNDQVLIQEYADGPEFAVDTIAQDGTIKIVALWKYHKVEANGAPFVYQCSELISSSGSVEREVCDYCIDILHAQDLKWGPTHTEIKYTKNGPRLIEINARWHAQHFPPIAQACLGYDAITTSLDTFFFPDKFESIPILPGTLQGAGRILHLISYFEGKVRSVNHMDEIQALDSVILANIEPEAGDMIHKTVDIRTDCGYVLLQHDDPKVVERDCDAIVKYQADLFTIYESIQQEEDELREELSHLPSFSHPTSSASSSEYLSKDPVVGIDEEGIVDVATLEVSTNIELSSSDERLTQMDYNLPSFQQPSTATLSSHHRWQSQLSSTLQKISYRSSHMMQKLTTLQPLAMRWVKAMLAATVLGYISLNLMVLILPMLMRNPLNPLP